MTKRVTNKELIERIEGLENLTRDLHARLIKNEVKVKALCRITRYIICFDKLADDADKWLSQIVDKPLCLGVDLEENVYYLITATSSKLKQINGDAYWHTYGVEIEALVSLRFNRKGTINFDDERAFGWYISGQVLPKPRPVKQVTK